MQLNIKKTSRKLIKLSVLLLLVCVPYIAMADPEEPGEDPDVPIDGGVSLLVAAGVGYGVKQLHAYRKKQ